MLLKIKNDQTKKTQDKACPSDNINQKQMRKKIHRKDGYTYLKRETELPRTWHTSITTDQRIAHSASKAHILSPAASSKQDERVIREIYTMLDMRRYVNETLQLVDAQEYQYFAE